MFSGSKLVENLFKQLGKIKISSTFMKGTYILHILIKTVTKQNLRYKLTLTKKIKINLLKRLMNCQSIYTHWLHMHAPFVGF